MVLCGICVTLNRSFFEKCLYVSLHFIGFSGVFCVYCKTTHNNGDIQLIHLVIYANSIYIESASMTAGFIYMQTLYG